jgi:hypothetical protein
MFSYNFWKLNVQVLITQFNRNKLLKTKKNVLNIISQQFRTFQGV